MTLVERKRGGRSKLSGSADVPELCRKYEECEAKRYPKASVQHAARHHSDIDGTVMRIVQVARCCQEAMHIVRSSSESEHIISEINNQLI